MSRTPTAVKLRLGLVAASGWEKRRASRVRPARRLLQSTPRGKPLLHGERRRRRHILPFDEQFSLGAAGARQRDLEGFDRR